MIMLTVVPSLTEYCLVKSNATLYPAHSNETIKCIDYLKEQGLGEPTY